MPNDRASLGLDDIDDDVDILELSTPTAAAAPKTDPKQKKALAEKLAKAGKEHGFVSREAKPVTKRRRKVSPYTAQFGGKCRPGMKELFQKIGDELNCYDTETLEEAILALIEKNNLSSLKAEYDALLSKK